jgi:hypothetical protein
MISGAIATGAAVANESDAELKIVRSDTSGTVKKTVIAVPAGVEVTLTEIEAQNFAPSANRVAAKAITGQQRQAVAAPAPIRVPTTSVAPTAAMDIDLSKSTVHTITWIDAESGSRYTLSGPLPVDQLEALKPRILKLKR